MKKLLPRAVFALTLLTSGIGLLHLPMARPLLAWIGVGCPAKASPEEVEAARREAASAARGPTWAKARPALGFTLDRTTKAEVEAWAKAAGLSCVDAERGTVLRCSQVSAAALGGDASERAPAGPVDDLSFAFSAQELRLVTVTTLRTKLSADQAASALEAISGALGAHLGEPGRRLGQATAGYLAGGALRTAMVEYRYQDYLATVSATNLGDRVALREHYMSAL